MVVIITVIVSIVSIVSVGGTVGMLRMCEPSVSEYVCEYGANKCAYGEYVLWH